MQARVMQFVCHCHDTFRTNSELVFDNTTDVNPTELPGAGAYDGIVGGLGVANNSAWSTYALSYYANGSSVFSTWPYVIISVSTSRLDGY